MPIWDILKNVIGKDMTKVSLPVIMNEPLSALQRNCEMITSGRHLYDRAANCEDPMERLALCMIAIILPMN